MKFASVNTIQQTLQSKFPGFYKILAGMPGFNQAMDVVEQIRSGVNPEQLGINQNIIDQANAWIVQVKGGQRQSSTSNNMRIAFTSDDVPMSVVIIAAIIAI